MKPLVKILILLTVMPIVLIPPVGCLEAVPAEPQAVPRTEDVLQPGHSESSDRGPLDTPPRSGQFFQDSYGNIVDYSNPELYLTSGSQSKLDKQYVDQIKSQIGIGGSGMEGIGMIFKWKQSYFKKYAAGGKFVGKMTVNQIMEKKELSGCHDQGLILASVFRLFGFLAIMVDTAGIQWALDYSLRTAEGFKGHVFVEVFAMNKWIVVDSTSGKYVENYDPSDPVIPITNPSESKGYYALFKGTDPAGYGISSNAQLTKCLEEFADKIHSIEISQPSYIIKRLPIR